MGYLQALQLMVRAYKAARGVMPKGLDLLKLKMRARQKAIDSKKVIQFPKDKITPFNKPRPTKPEGIIPVTVKGKTTKMSPEGIMNMLMKKGKDVKLGQAPKTTKVKEPVDPKLVLQESEKEMAKRMMRETKEAIKRFKEKMKKPRDDKATGGLANISQTYDNNPTLQSQYPNKQDYLDLFSSTTTTTPQTQTYTQMTQQSPAGIPAVKPIVPIIPQGDGGDGGGGITTRTGYGYRGPSMTTDDIEEGTITSEEERFAQGQALKGLAQKTLIGNLFFKAKDAVSDKARDIANKVRAEEIARAEALRSLQESIARNQARASQQDWSGASSDYSGGMDSTTGNYDDPYSPGDTE